MTRNGGGGEGEQGGTDVSGTVGEDAEEDALVSGTVGEDAEVDADVFGTVGEDVEVVRICSSSRGRLRLKACSFLYRFTSPERSEFCTIKFAACLRTVVMRGLGLLAAAARNTGTGLNTCRSFAPSTGGGGMPLGHGRAIHFNLYPVKVILSLA
jgi:hypothetical protein